MTRNPALNAMIDYTLAEADLARCTRLMDTKGYRDATQRLRAARNAILGAGVVV